MTSPAPTDKPAAKGDKLSEQLQSIIEQAEQIVATAQEAGRELTDDERARHTELCTRAEQLGEDLTRARTVARIRAIANDGAPGRIERGAPNADDPYDADPLGDPRDGVTRTRHRQPWSGEISEWGRTADQVTAEYRSRALSAIEQMPGATDTIRAAATTMIETWDDDRGRLSRLALALSEPSYFRAFSKSARNPHAVELEPDERHAVQRVRELARALSLTDSAGGYLVPFQLDPTVIITSAGSRNQIRDAARTVVATGDVWHGVSAGAVTWSWAAEGAEATDNAPTFAQPSVPVFKAHGFVPVSIEAFEDAANITNEVARLLAFGKDNLEAAAFISGTGSGQPTGLVTALAGSASQVAAGTAGAFAAADVYALDSALPARHRAAASWLANRSIFNRVRQFGTTDGANMWERIGAEQPALLLGQPAREAEAMDSTLDATVGNDHILIAGDFEHYVIADRVGFTVELIPHLVGTNRMPTGQRGWYAYYRVGAGVTNIDAFRLLAA